MKRRHRWLGALLFAGVIALVGAPTAAIADDSDELTPDEVTEGTARIKLNTEFAVPYMDGERYENHAFEKSGTILVLPNLDRTTEHVFELRPADEAFEPAPVSVTKKCWKLKRVEKRLKMWRCDLRVKFPKAKTKPKPPPEPEPEPEDDPDVPPMPGVPPPPPEYRQ